MLAFQLFCLIVAESIYVKSTSLVQLCAQHESAIFKRYLWLLKLNSAAQQLVRMPNIILETKPFISVTFMSFLKYIDFLLHRIFCILLDPLPNERRIAAGQTCQYCQLGRLLTVCTDAVVLISSSSINGRGRFCRRLRLALNDPGGGLFIRLVIEIFFLVINDSSSSFFGCWHGAVNRVCKGLALLHGGLDFEVV